MSVLHGRISSVAGWRTKRLWQLELLAGVRHRMWSSAARKMISEGFSALKVEWVNSRGILALRLLLEYSILKKDERLKLVCSTS